MKRGRFKKERLHEAMKVRGIAKPADLARALKENPQTAYKWWAGQTVNISASDLFHMADRLDVNARWLMGLSETMTKGRNLEPDEDAVLAIYRSLKALPQQGWVDDWLTDGNKLVERLSPAPSQSTPFSKKQDKMPTN